MKSPKRILIFTDAWEPQVNGVVRTFQEVIKCTDSEKYQIIVISPNDFRLKFSLPTYKSIKIAFPNPGRIKNALCDYKPDYVHIATEGPIGLMAARVCNKESVPYTSSYHTKFPEYINKRFSWIKKEWVYRVLNLVHKNAKKTLVTTESMIKTLVENGFNPSKLVKWGRGVDTTVFTHSDGPDAPFPILLYVGRVSIEKNLESFLDIEYSGIKIVVGDGPDLPRLREMYLDDPNVFFLGELVGEELVEQYQGADVFVFPSKSDTFGIVQLEAMACGTPVAAYPETGPIDVIEPEVNGYYSEDLKWAIDKCISLNRRVVSNSVKHLSWNEVAKTFVENMYPVGK